MNDSSGYCSKNYTFMSPYICQFMQCEENTAVQYYTIIEFSTSDNAILAFCLVHCISVISHYTYVLPYMEINATNVKFFVGSQLGSPEVSSTKIWMRKKQIRWAVYKRNTRNYGQCRPSNNEKAIKFGIRIVSLKRCKTSIWTSRIYAFVKIM